jgi:hypothetical protein
MYSCMIWDLEMGNDTGPLWESLNLYLLFMIEVAFRGCELDRKTLFLFYFQASKLSSVEKLYVYT